jgi:hypothetical protein
MSSDRLMQADDLFEENIQQIFSVRTGNRIGYRGPAGFSTGFYLPDPPPLEEPDPPEPENENQLTLFNE